MSMMPAKIATSLGVAIAGCRRQSNMEDFSIFSLLKANNEFITQDMHDFQEQLMDNYIKLKKHLKLVQMALENTSNITFGKDEEPYTKKENKRLSLKRSLNYHNLRYFQHDITQDFTLEKSSFITITYDPSRFYNIVCEDEMAQIAYLKKTIENSLYLVYDLEFVDEVKLLLCFEKHKSGIFHCHFMINLSPENLETYPIYDKRFKKYMSSFKKDSFLWNLRRHLSLTHKNNHCINVRPVNSIKDTVDYLSKDNNIVYFVSTKQVNDFERYDECYCGLLNKYCNFCV